MPRRRYAEFERRLPNMASVSAADVPWPPEHDVLGVPLGDAGRKKALHRALLRWHPDKWAPVLAKASPDGRQVGSVAPSNRTA